MKRFMIALMALVFAMGMPMIAVAMSHGDHADPADNGKAMAEEMKQQGDMQPADHDMHTGHGLEMAEEMKQHGDMEHADEGMHEGHDMGKDHDMKMDHAKEMSHDMHDGHDGHDMAGDAGGFAEIGQDTQAGVVATVKVKTYDAETLATMAKMGMNATHHVMVFFADEKSGEDVVDGKVALKVKGPDAKSVMLMQMGTGFGGDVSLEEGMYTFEIGTKLADGEKRKFEVGFHNM